MLFAIFLGATWLRQGIATKIKARGGLTSATIKKVKRINANNTNSYAMAA